MAGWFWPITPEKTFFHAVLRGAKIATISGTVILSFASCYDRCRNVVKMLLTTAILSKYARIAFSSQRIKWYSNNLCICRLALKHIVNFVVGTNPYVAAILKNQKSTSTYRLRCCIVGPRIHFITNIPVEPTESPLMLIVAKYRKHKYVKSWHIP